jgi:hypothetical protein
MDKIVRENRDIICRKQVTANIVQFNEKMVKYRKSKFKNIVKYNLLGLFVLHVTILWLTDFR